VRDMISRSKLTYSLIGGFILAAVSVYLLASGVGGSVLRFDSTRFQIASGQGLLTQNGFEITAAAPETNQAMVVVSLDQPVEAEDFPNVSFKVPGLDQAVGAGMFWITAVEPTKGHPMPLTMEQVRSGRVSLETAPEWRGKILRIGFVVQGPWSAPVTFRELGVLPREVAFSELAARWARQWTHWTPWDGRAINFYMGAELTERQITPVVFTALWVLWAALIFFAWRGEQLRTTLAVLVLGGWALLDTRWQIDLWQRHGRELDEAVFLEDQRRQMMLSELKARQFDSRPDARIFIISADPTGYAAYRTRYHLAAANTSFGLDRLPSAAERREGDYLIVFGLRDRLEYSRSSGILESSSERISADLIANAPEIGGVFRVRAER